MAKCKTEGCKKEAQDGDEYCAACKCKNNKEGKTVLKVVFGVLVAVGAAVFAWHRSSDQA